MKRYFKPIIALFLAVMIAILNGCSNGNNNDTPVDYSSLSENANKVEAYNEEAAGYSLSIDASKEVHDISDMLYGIFFEDINFAADGGLYAEKVANRSFEFTSLAKDNEMYAWSIVGDATAEVKKNQPDCLNENNPNYIIVKSNAPDSGIANRGFLEGMSIEKDAEYDFSVYARAIDGYNGGLTVRLMAGDKQAGSVKIDAVTSEWVKYDAEIEASISAKENVTLQVLTDGGSVALDMISLFPTDTYKNRENGLRNDIATLLEELHPKFLRFPGGCVIEGYDESTAYNWKASVGADKDGKPLKFNGKYGDVAARRQGIDLWTDINATDDEYPSFMSYGLGFFEYFQLAEDIGAVGVPVINAGLYCQARGGQGVDMKSEKFRGYIQDMLDLVEFCRGDESTTWGKVRASLGHEDPFELKYICIGNENWGDTYYKRYSAFLDAFNKAKQENPKLYNGIELIYSAGTDDGDSGADYIKSYEYAKKQIGNNEINSFAGAIDHHYYNSPDWFYRNADYYDEDNYSRTAAGMDKGFGGGINVFLGEYASLTNTMNSALSEAAYMTGLERNGDIVRMATYAPLLSSTVARHWAPNLIWFDNSSCMGSISYYMQRLFSTNAGTTLLKSELKGADHNNFAFTGKVGLGTWNTSASFDNLRITDNKTGEILAEDNFDKNDLKDNWQIVSESEFAVENGVLTQSMIDAPFNELGQTAYFGDTSWTDYTITVDATKNDGDEGFLIPFAVSDESNNLFWNIGGWSNTVSCLQEISNGFKTGQVDGTVKDVTIENGRTYQLKVVVSGNNVKCYIDDELYVDYTDIQNVKSDAYQVVSTDASGDIIIKIVNVKGTAEPVAISLSDIDEVNSEAVVYQVAANDIKADNIPGQNNHITMNEFEINGISTQFNYVVPEYSATVIRISR